MSFNLESGLPLYTSEAMIVLWVDFAGSIHRVSSGAKGCRPYETGYLGLGMAYLAGGL